jgi:hypothetical protein
MFWRSGIRVADENMRHASAAAACSDSEDGQHARARSRRVIAYLLVFAACALLTGALANAVEWGSKVLQCAASEHRADTFMSFCANLQFGDYEHGAFRYGLEPTARDNARRAQVLFLGNSRMMFGFSSQATERFFRERNIRFFLLGFAYGTNSSFILPLVKALHARPKLIIINADPFFGVGAAPDIQKVIDGRPATRWNYLLKWAFQYVHTPACRLFPSRCMPPHGAIFRSRVNGRYLWDKTYLRKDQLAHARQIVPKRDAPAERNDLYLGGPIAIGREFLKDAPVRRDCIILTGVPNNTSNSEDVARWMAEALGLRWIIPSADGLVTLEGAHLDAPSAELWSSRFLAELDPVLKECL